MKLLIIECSMYHVLAPATTSLHQCSQASSHWPLSLCCLAQPLWKTELMVHNKLRIQLPCTPAVSLQGICSQSLETFRRGAHHLLLCSVQWLRHGNRCVDHEDLEFLCRFRFSAKWNWGFGILACSQKPVATPPLLLYEPTFSLTLIAEGNVTTPSFSHPKAVVPKKPS